MAEETSLEGQLAQLTRRIDDQARFTRTVVVVCTTAILGVMFYMLTIVFAELPYVFMVRYIESLDKIVYQWRTIEERMVAGRLPRKEPAAQAHPAR